MSCRLLAVLGLLLLCACSPSATPVAAPTPQVVTLALTSTMGYLRPMLADCAAQQPELGLVIEDAAASPLTYQTLTLRWGAVGLEQRIASGELQAYQLGEDELVIATNPQTAPAQLSIEALRAFLRGEAAERHFYSYPSGEDVQQIVEQALAGGASLGSTTWLAPDPSALVEVIAANPQAIGPLPRRWLHENITLLRITGLETAALTFPILAVSTQPLPQAEQALLACVQERLR